MADESVDRAGRTDLHYAALENDADQVQELLAAGADVDARDKAGFTPLHFAAQQFALEAGQLLVAAGADIEARNRFGATPLMTAVASSKGYGEFILLLREHGADPCTPNNSGQSPVGLARLIANYDVAQYFDDVAWDTDDAVDDAVDDSVDGAQDPPSLD